MSSRALWFLYTVTVVASLLLLESFQPGFLLLAWQVIVEVLSRSAAALAWPLALVGSGWIGYRYGVYESRRDTLQRVARATANRPTDEEN